MGRTQRDPEQGRDPAKQFSLAPDGRADLRAPAARALERRLGKHHRELLAAITAGDVAAADVTFQERTHLHEHLVACLVAGAVVDVLETVEIHHDQRKRRALAPCADQLPLQIVLQESAVVEGSQRVADRLLAQFLQEALRRLDRAPAVLDDRVQHEPRRHHRAQEREQQQQRLVQRPLSERPAAIERKPHGHCAYQRVHGRDFALLEAESGPYDERQDRESERHRRDVRGHAGAEYRVHHSRKIAEGFLLDCLLAGVMYAVFGAGMTPYITPDRRQTRRNPSAIFRGVQAGLARAAQPRIKGVTMMIPTVSPCHHVHQFHNNSGDSSECTKASGAAATVAAIVALAAAMATNLTTCSPRRNGPGKPIRARTSAAPASASRVLPAPMRVAATSEDWTVTLTSEAPSQIPGQMRVPSSRSDATAIPEGGHTAVA